ncbi:hypothetical protein BKA82DRAFT_3266918 [Pisolithus tinctorius]|nr:hypothetical protein BKA82DRAFT_3266918 [Pisolithus tinctorius]
MQKKKKQSPGRVQTRTGDRFSTPEISSTASRGMLARMRSFHRSSQSPSTSISRGLANTATGGRVQEKQEESTEAITAQDAAATSTGSEEQEQWKVVPTKNAEKSIVKPTEASAGKGVGTAVKDFGGIDPIPCIDKGAVAVGNPSTTLSEVQNLSDTYLKPFKVFNQVVSTLANVHPYAQIALGILTSAAQTAQCRASSTRCEPSTNFLRKKIA